LLFYRIQEDIKRLNRIREANMNKMCFLLEVILFMVGCSTTGKFMKLSLGMTKQEVIKTIGRPTVLKGATTNERGQTIEVFEYDEYKTISDRLYSIHSPYLLYFVDDKLQKWE